MANDLDVSRSVCEAARWGRSSPCFESRAETAFRKAMCDMCDDMKGCYVESEINKLFSAVDC